MLAVPLLGSDDWVGVCVGLKYFSMASQNSKNKSTGSARRARSDSSARIGRPDSIDRRDTRALVHTSGGDRVHSGRHIDTAR